MSIIEEDVVPYASIVTLLVACQRRAREPLLSPWELMAKMVSGTISQSGAI